MRSVRARFVIATAACACVITACSLVTSFSDLTGGANPNADGAAQSASDAPPLNDSNATSANRDANAEGGAGAACPSAAPSVASGLIGYFPMEESDGTTIFDCSGNAYNGALQGSDAKHTPGHIGNALGFGGNDGCVVFPVPTPQNLAFNGQNPFSVAMWVRIDASSTTWPRGYLTGISTDPSTAGWRLAYENSGTSLTFSYPKPDGGGIFEPSTGGIAFGAWHHFATVFSTDIAINVFLDGAIKGTDPANAFLADTVSLRFGCSGDNQNYLIGAIDDVRFYDRALSPAEVTTLAGQ